jgi:hypothetical protein
MKKSLKDTLLLRPKVEIKKSEINLSATEKAVAKIHQAELVTPTIEQTIAVVAPEIVDIPVVVPEKPAPKPIVAEKHASALPLRKNAKAASPAPSNVKMEIEQERTKRVTLDIPISMHTDIKMKTFRQSITIREYLLGLAAKDLNGGK